MLTFFVLLREYCPIYQVAATARAAVAVSADSAFAAFATFANQHSQTHAFALCRRLRGGIVAEWVDLSPTPVSLKGERDVP